eukprot:568009-Pleurochrysis_carterae.AAC.1
MQGDGLTQFVNELCSVVYNDTTSGHIRILLKGWSVIFFSVTRVGSSSTEDGAEVLSIEHQNCIVLFDMGLFARAPGAAYRRIGGARMY